jgi:hypothetical protein
MSVFEEEGPAAFAAPVRLPPGQATLRGMLQHLQTRNIQLLSVECTGAGPKKR